MAKRDKVLRKRMTSDNVQAMLMIAPFFIGFILFSYVPIVYILRYAFTDYGGFGACQITGIANFVRIVKRSRFLAVSYKCFFACSGETSC